ncbi:MAG: patatin-like phospholipase family protein [Anaerolineae bacterium]|nr:patatin-like phospholipase family protein [Anaerolineae bacterium]
MNDSTIREHIGIAVDGGGVKGAIVAQGLIELEELLGVSPLIDSPRLKVVAGTSTGSLIASALMVGMTGAEILDLYRTLGEKAFSKPGPLRPFGRIPLDWVPVPNGLVRAIGRIPLGIGDILLYSLFPARYSFDPLRKTLRNILKNYPVPTDNPTLEQMGDYLRTQHHGPTLIITAAEVSARRTHFLKTTLQERYKHMRLVDAMLASSCIPTYFPPVPLPTNDPDQRWLVDGGVGSFGNPALVVAWELCDQRNIDESRHYDPSEVTLFSFGTGTVSRDIYRKAYGKPTRWWALDWVSRVLDMFTDTAIREQSRSIVSTYRGIDLRRFQVELDRPVGADEFELMDTVLAEKGEELRALVRENRHALHPDPALRHDPEGIWYEVLGQFVPSM